MKRTSDGHNKNIKWKYCILCQRNDVSLGNLRGAGKECDTLVGNLKEIWGLDKSRIDINCNSFIQSSDGTPDFTETFKQNNAVFHHDCTSRYSSPGPVIQSRNNFRVQRNFLLQVLIWP